MVLCNKIAEGLDTRYIGESEIAKSREAKALVLCVAKMSDFFIFSNRTSRVLL
ncbi:hypothetical protein LEP1GSC171_2918 [Leptospira santarosai str. HAI1380]|nr:hypothetical protein LEP1GSC171_2918 [Leptospira santarosai str. HAI1380]